jgi:hypothetical protein
MWQRRNYTQSVKSSFGIFVAKHGNKMHKGFMKLLEKLPEIAIDGQNTNHFACLLNLLRYEKLIQSN